MPYATLSDLIERAGEAEIRQIADRDRDGAIDADVIESALINADNLVNGYVATKYDMPLPSVPDLVRSWAVSIARYFLHHNGAPEHVVRDYDNALAALKDVVAGKATLSVAPGEIAPAPSSGTVMSAHPPTVFTPEKLQGWS